jgi:type VI secretion system secreted protein Hcp
MASLSYLTLEGKTQGKFETECPTAGFEKKIEVYAVDHTIETPTDPNTGLATGTVLHRVFKIVKAKDETSPLIMQAASTGETFTKWELEFTRITKDGVQEIYYKITLDPAVCVHRRQYKHHQKDEAYSSYFDEEEIWFTYEKIIESHEVAGKETEIDWKSPKT